MRKESRQALESRQESMVERMGGYHADAWHGATGNGAFKVLGQFDSDRFTTFAKLVENDRMPKGFGLEIECVCFSTSMENVFMWMLKRTYSECFPDDLFKTQTDVSLLSNMSRGKCTSGEAITQVMTKAFIRNNYPNFRKFFANLEAIGANPAYVDPDGRRHCGMHTNVSASLFGKDLQSQKLALRKLVYIGHKYRKTIGKATGRDFINDGYYHEMRNWTRVKDDENQIQRYDDHGDCVNLGHYNWHTFSSDSRVEIRLIGPSENYECFRNSMELAFFLVDRVKTISWDECDSIDKVFRGCNQYVKQALQSAGTLRESVMQRITENVVEETKF